MPAINETLLQLVAVNEALTATVTYYGQLLVGVLLALIAAATWRG